MVNSVSPWQECVSNNSHMNKTPLQLCEQGKIESNLTFSLAGVECGAKCNDSHDENATGPLSCVWQLKRVYLREAVQRGLKCELTSWKPGECCCSSLPSTDGGEEVTGLPSTQL